METLADRIAREGALPPRDAAGWVIRLAKRIEALHAMGVTHGTISAACIMVEDGPPASRGQLVDVRRVANHPGYHSPERATGAGISTSDDAWAVAVVLYHALTGQLPFTGDTDEQVREQVLGARPSPLAVFGIAEDALQRLLDAALERDVSRRTIRVADLRRALEAATGEVSGSSWMPLEDDTDVSDDGEYDRTLVRPPPTPPGTSAYVPPRPAAGTPPAAPAAMRPAQAPRPAGQRSLRASTPGPRSSATGPAPRPGQAPRGSAPQFVAGPPLGTAPAPAAAAPPPAVPQAPVEGPPRGPDPAPGPPAPPMPIPAGTVRIPPEARPQIPAPVGPPPAPPPPPPSSGDLALLKRTLPINRVMAPPLPAQPPAPQPQRQAWTPPVESPSRPQQAWTPAAPPIESPSHSQAWAAAPPQPQMPPPQMQMPQPQMQMPQPQMQMPQPQMPQPQHVAQPGAHGPPPPAWQFTPPPTSPTDARFAAAAPAPPPKSSAKWAMAGFAMLAIAVGGAGALLILPRLSRRNAPLPPAEEPALEPSASSAAIAVEAPSAASSASPAPEAAPAVAAEPPACMVAMFPPDTWPDPAAADLGFVCTERDPRRGGPTLRAAVVRAGGPAQRRVSEGMREWAALGWYEIAAFAVIRNRCCEAPQPMVLPPEVSGCPSFDGALAAMMELAPRGGSASGNEATPELSGKIDAAIAEYDQSLRCIIRAGASGNYGGYQKPQGGEDATFKKTMLRAVAR